MAANPPTVPEHLRIEGFDHPNVLTALPPLDVAPVESLSDTEYLDRMAFAIRAESAGTIKVTTAAGEDRPLKFKAGETRVGQFTRIWSSTTDVDAADIELAYHEAPES